MFNVRETNAGGEEDSGGEVRGLDVRSVVLKFPSGPRERVPQ